MDWSPLFAVFYSCDARRPVPHSFPTRRSSDLALRFLGDRTLQRLIERPHAVDSEESFAHCLAKRDRKSTRLNSSHEWISYAVFCLKRKSTGRTVTVCRMTSTNATSDSI